MGILPHLIPFLKPSDPNLVLPVFSNHTMYTMYIMQMITRPRFLAIMAILLAALCSQASACTGETQCCLRRRLLGYDMHRSFAGHRRRLVSRAARAHRRRRRLCKDDPCDGCADCDGATMTRAQAMMQPLNGQRGRGFDLAERNDDDLQTFE